MNQDCKRLSKLIENQLEKDIDCGVYDGNLIGLSNYEIEDYENYFVIDFFPIKLSGIDDEVELRFYIFEDILRIDVYFGHLDKDLSVLKLINDFNDEESLFWTAYIEKSKNLFTLSHTEKYSLKTFEEDFNTAFSLLLNIKDNPIIQTLTKLTYEVEQ